MQPAKPVIAIYDMDKTITRRPTWTPFLIHAARHIAPWRLALLPLCALAVLAYLAGILDRAGLKEATMRMMLGSQADPGKIAAVAEGFADGILRYGVFKGAIAQIAADRAEGARIVLATASCAFYVRAIAARLGIADVVATEVQHSATGALLPHIAGENCYGPAKLRMIANWFATQGLTRSDVSVRFYSDHVSDAPALEWADAGIAVNPHPPLRRLAGARHWRVIDWV